MAGSVKSSYVPKSFDEEKSKVAPPVTQDRINYVRIQSLVQAHLVYTGRSSGKQYDWLRAGAIVSVDEADVSDLLEKRLGGQSCCGQPDNKVFQLAS